MSRDSAGDEPDEPDAARWWQAYQLADRDQVDELARWLDRLRERAAAGDEIARQILAEWPA